MKTQLDTLNTEKRNLLQIITQIEKHGHTDTDMYKYYKNRYYIVVDIINNIR